MTPHLWPRRVVSLQPSATVTLRDLGLLDRLVACTRWCADQCPEAAEGRLLVSDSWTAKADQILSARPDLVLASVPYQTEALAEILKAGVPFLALAPKALQDIYHDILLIAGVMGVPDRGQQVVQSIQNKIKQVRSLTAVLGRPRVFCEEWGKPIIHSQRWVAELVEVAGGEFLGQPGRQTTAEAVAAMDPDVIIAAWCGAGDRVPLEKLVRDRGWENLRAARQRRVYCVPDEYFNTPASTLLHGLGALAGILHPERFPPEPRVGRIQ